MREDRKNLIRRWSSWRNVPVKIENLDWGYLMVFDFLCHMFLSTREEAEKELEKLILKEESRISGVDSFEELELLMESLGI